MTEAAMTSEKTQADVESGGTATEWTDARFMRLFFALCTGGTILGWFASDMLGRM
jgi:hypothetical protein